MATQLAWSAVQMVGRLFGIVTTTPDAGAGPLTGIDALALATAAYASERASALASAFALALAFAVAAVFAAVWLWSLSSFCSSIFNCCFSSAISCSLLLADWAWTCEVASAAARPSAALHTFPDHVKLPPLVMHSHRWKPS